MNVCVSHTNCHTARRLPGDDGAAADPSPREEGAYTRSSGTSPPLVSIVIVTFNARRFVPALIASLDRQDYQHYELVFLDSASTDGTADLLAALAPAATLIRSPVNLGYAAGNNAALAHCHGDYIALLNPDTTVDPGWLTALVNALEMDPSVGLATAKIVLLSDPSTINTCGNDVHVAGFATCRGLNAPANTHREAADVSAVSGAAFIIRRALMERLGGFDEGFFMYVEDTDLSWRAQLLGARCRYVPESIVAHQYRLDLSANKTYFLERNRWQLLLKCYQARTLLCLLPALIFGEILAWGYAALRGPAHLRAKLRAVSWIWVHRSEIGAHRAAVQTNRRAGDEGLLHLATVYPPIGLIAPGRVTRMLGSIAAIPFAISRWLTLTIVRPRR